MSKWTQEYEVLMCKLRLAGMKCKDIAEALTNQGRPTTVSAVHGRLFRRGITIQKGTRWWSERDEELTQMVIKEGGLDNLMNKAWEEHSDGLVDHPWWPLKEREQEFKSQYQLRYEQLKWQHEHLCDVPFNRNEWETYCQNLLGFPGPKCWRCDDELVIRHPAGRSSICPACMWRPNRQKFLPDALRQTLPRTQYTGVAS